MKKRVAALALAGLMAAAGLAACGASGVGDQGGQKTAKAKYKVGVIQAVQHDALDAATRGFEQALKDEMGDQVAVTVQNAAGDSANDTTIANAFVSDGVDLIMANATPALQAASQATSAIPVVGTSVTDYATALDISGWSGKTGTNVTGTSDLAPIEQQAAMIQELFPKSKKVGILYCTAEANSKYQADEMTRQLQGKGYEVSSFTFSDSNDVASVTGNAVAASDLIYIPTDNTAASCTSTINPIALQAKKPIVCGEEGLAKGCGLATLSISYYDLGYQTGKMAARILRDKAKPGDMSIETAGKVAKEYNPDIARQLNIEIPSDYQAIDMAGK